MGDVAEESGLHRRDGRFRVGAHHVKRNHVSGKPEIVFRPHRFDEVDSDDQIVEERCEGLLVKRFPHRGEVIDLEAGEDPQLRKLLPDPFQVGTILFQFSVLHSRTAEPAVGEGGVIGEAEGGDPLPDRFAAVFVDGSAGMFAANGVRVQIHPIAELHVVLLDFPIIYYGLLVFESFGSAGRISF